MSLIEEALRKAQLERPGEREASVAVEEPPPRVRATPQKAADAPAPSSPPAVPLARGAGVLLLGGLAWVLWNSRASSPPAVPRAPSTAVAAARPMFRKPPPFHLTGVVAGPGEPLAIINGQIVKVGDTVSDAMLLEVGSNQARLRWGDEELVLTTSR